MAADPTAIHCHACGTARRNKKAGLCSPAPLSPHAFRGACSRAVAMIGLFTSLESIACEQHSSLDAAPLLAVLQRNAKINVVKIQQSSLGCLRFAVR